MKQPTTLAPFACPKCGNTTAQKGISHAWIEWRVAGVLGSHDGKPVVNFQDNEGESIGPGERFTRENVPNDVPDLSHFHCNACSWNWFLADTVDSFDLRK
jgi:hypothetical protein